MDQLLPTLDGAKIRNIILFIYIHIYIYFGAPVISLFKERKLAHGKRQWSSRLYAFLQSHFGCLC